MASITAEHRPGYACHFEIEEEEYFLSEADIEQEFVRTRGCSYTPEDPSEEKIRANALKLIAYNNDGSMIFSEKRWGYTFKFSKDQNDGTWISVDKCVQLFKENSPKIKPVYVQLDRSLCMRRM